MKPFFINLIAASCRIKFFIFLLFLINSLCYGADIFEYQGPKTRVSGGLSSLESRSGAACLHNPANLVLSGSKSYVDIGLANFTYTFSPADTGLNTGIYKAPIIPLTSIGTSLKPSFLKAITFGFLFIPLGAPGLKSEIKDFPFKSEDGGFMSDMELEESSFKMGLGVGWSFKKRFKLGISAMYHGKDSSINIKSQETGDSIMKISDKSSYLIPKAGFRTRILSRFGLAFTYRPPVWSKYAVNVELPRSQSISSRAKKYHAAVYTLGIEVKLNRIFTPYFQYQREEWLPGTKGSTPSMVLVKTGRKVPTEFLNTNNYVLGIKIRLNKRSKIYTGYAKYGSNKGDGVYDANKKIAIAGVGPRDFEALDRTHYTVGYQQRNMIAYLTYIYSVKIAAKDTPGAGFYNLKIYLLGGSFFL